MNETQNKYILYTRKSSEASDRQVHSLEDQAAEGEKVAEKESLSLIYKFKENQTAHKPNRRPKFTEMLELINKEKANSILCWDADRLSRNPQEGGMIVQLLEDGVIHEIKTMSGETYTPDSDNHLVLEMKLGMANQYSRNLSKNVKRGLQYKAERGQYPRPAVTGYRSIGEPGNRNIEPEPFEAPLVVKVCELAQTGQYSLGYLTEYLYLKGLRSKAGNKISKSQWKALLSNPVLYGQFYWKGEIFQGGFAPLITKSLFDKVQEGLGLRAKPKRQTLTHWTNGLMFCPVCGCQVSTTTKKKVYKRTKRTAEYNYLRCTHQRPCKEKPISLAEFEKQLLPIVDKISIDQETWELGIELFKAMENTEKDRDLSSIDAIFKQLKETRERLSRLRNMRLDNELTKEEFIEKKNELLKEEATLNDSYNQLRNRGSNWFELVEKFINTAFYARDILLKGTPEEKRNLVLDLGSNLLLQDKTVKFEFKTPFNLLLKPNCMNWLGD